MAQEVADVPLDAVVDARRHRAALLLQDLQDSLRRLDAALLRDLRHVHAYEVPVASVWA